MGFYSSNDSDLVAREELRTVLGTPQQDSASSPTATDKGIIGLLKGLWQNFQETNSILNSTRLGDEGIFWHRVLLVNSFGQPISIGAGANQNLGSSTQGILINATNSPTYIWASGNSFMQINNNAKSLSIAIQKSVNSGAVALSFFIEWNIAGIVAPQNILTVPNGGNAFTIPVSVPVLANQFRLYGVRTSGTDNVSITATGIAIP